MLGHKSDVNDSIWITKLLLAGLLKPSFIPPREQRELRDLTSYRRKLIEFRSDNKNRVIRTLEDGNIQLSTALTDTNGKTDQTLIEMVCSGEELTESKIENIRHKRWSVQIRKGVFLQQKYYPDYLEDAPSYIPDYMGIVSKVKPGRITGTELFLDGGNILIEDRKTILTDKVFYENCKEDSVNVADEPRQKWARTVDARK